jgi:N-acetylmuramoyl-L-alanine amidase
VAVQLINRLSPNHDARAAGAAIDMLVLHYTGMRTAEEALARLCDPAAKVSAHYTIDREGRIYAQVPEERRAWHAGVSCWQGARDINSRSIGIELVNPGHEFGYIPFTDEQIAALIALSSEILVRHPIPARHVLGHSDIAPARKEDPGELFPWPRLAQSGIGLWPSVTLSEASANSLSNYGYDADAPRERVILAFQRHFRSAKLTGKWDTECGQLLAGLLAATA